IIGVKEVLLAIEENKMSAIFAMEKALVENAKKAQSASIRIVVLKTKYPQGGEKQLIKAMLGREVPPGKLPLDVGALVQNVGTCFAIYEAAYKGKPLIERCVTFTGSILREPGNFTVKIGTSLKHIADYCGGFSEPPAKIITGGPMMGIAQYNLDVPLIKGVTGAVFLSKKEAEIFEESPCIRCAECVDVCPVNLLPTEIMRMVKHSRWHNMDSLNPTDCVECGACAYSCPSRIPLVQYIKLAKMKAMGKK
ncbi:RnfABCDGE type electron transport complex subunit C, partial [Candidatus Omnitrophota bacterium]